MTQQQILDEYKHDLLGVFGDPSLVLVEGSGNIVTDANGKQYLDLLAGIAVNSLGHAHPRWVQAVQQQAAKLAHISNFFTSPTQVRLASTLIEKLSPVQDARVFFCNSGAEANEAAYKLARRHGNLSSPQRTTILALEHGFHGRTTGALALTHKPAYREPFEPLPTGIKHIPATLEALEAHCDETVAALIVEPIQGEAGVLPLPPGYLARARELTRANGALLIVDEVQTGMGRTGLWFECTRELSAENLPDVITLAKGLGAGFPVGAMIVVGQNPAALLQPGMHGTTFGGNPLATATALATVETIDEEHLLSNAEKVGAYIRERVGSLPEVDETTGRGLLIGIRLTHEKTRSGLPLAPTVVERARHHGFIINATGPSVVRLAPALNISIVEVENFCRQFPAIVSEADNC